MTRLEASGLMGGGSLLEKLACGTLGRRLDFGNDVTGAVVALKYNVTMSSIRFLRASRNRGDAIH